MWTSLRFAAWLAKVRSLTCTYAVWPALGPARSYVRPGSANRLSQSATVTGDCHCLTR
jgi:hypothetical protein